VLGCTPTREPPSSSIPPLDRAEAVQRLLDAMTAAAAAADRSAFDRQLSSGAPTTADRGRIWFANLRTLGAQLRLRSTTRDAVPAIGTRTRFQDRAWLQQIDASWRPTAAEQPARATFWLTVVAEDDRTLFVDDTDTPPADRASPRPLWLQTTVAVLRRDSVTVLGTDRRTLRPWLERAAAAAVAVRSRIPRWTGDLVVEVPADEASFERSVGVARGTYARIGAVAWPRGAQAATAPVAIVANPAVTGRLDGEALSVLLTHEAVHVATRSFASPAPTWLVEGYADQIAYAARPAGRAAALRPLRDAVRAGRLPTTLPAEADFAPAAADLDLAYAQAWSLCRLIAARYGDRGLDTLYAAVDGTVDSPVDGQGGRRGDAMAAALRRLGTDEAALVRDWRSELRRLDR
jgi:hypothetical protein